MPQTLSFAGKDILNGQLVDGDHVVYAVATTGGILGRKVTTLQASDGSLSATLHWRKRSLDVGGQILSVDDHVKPHEKARTWEWNNTTYEVQFMPGEWTVKAPTGKVLARFRPNHIPGKKQPHIVWERELSPADTALLILALLYSEKKWKAKPESGGNANADGQVYFAATYDQNPARGVYGGYIGGADGNNENAGFAG
ncbi:hypothetical protein EV714DRAFT_206695 [Schizophyllum commune]